ncbi:MAG: glycosyltransferase family 9 protein [Thermodesulfobacteriota bacterium]
MSHRVSIAGSGRALVLLRGALGDALMTLPFLAALPEHLRTRGLSLVGQPSSLSPLAHLSWVAGVHDFNQADWAGLYSSPARVTPRLGNFIQDHQAGVVLTRNPADPIVSGLVRAGLNQVLVVPSRPPAGVHYLDHLFASAGVRPLDRFVILTPKNEGLDRARSFLLAKGLKEKSFLTLHPGSGGAGKNWPLERWLELAEGLERETRLKTVFLLGPAEEEWIAKLEKEDRVVAGNMPLEVVAGLISLGLGHAGHDSGVTHLAAALDRPALAIFGPTDPAQWAPRGPQTVVVCSRRVEGKTVAWTWPAAAEVLAAFKELARL